MNDISIVTLQWMSDEMSDGGSSASGHPGSSSHDSVEGWMSGADNADSWGYLIFSD